MATSLVEFLRTRAAEDAGKAEANRAIIEEWKRAVESLLMQIMDWLRDADPDGYQLRPSLGQETVTEPPLGRYLVMKLELSPLFGTWVGVIPKARYTIGTITADPETPPQRATGQVDLTDAIRKHVLYRQSRAGQPDRWFIEDFRGMQKPLDREAFEVALLSYLR